MTQKAARGLLELAERQAQRQKREAVEARERLEAYAQSLPHIQESRQAFFGGKEITVVVDLDFRKHPHNAARLVELYGKENK
jgi:hypothetical protein